MYSHWNHANREMEREYLERLSLLGAEPLDRESAELVDRIARYSLMRIYLDDYVGRILVAQGKTALAREFRLSQRQFFADRLNEFAVHAMSAHAENFLTNVASRSWGDYAASLRASGRIRYTIFELRLSFILHGRGWAGVDFFVSRACKRIPQCFRLNTATFEP